MITQAERVALPEAEASPAVPVTSADHSSTSSSGKKKHRLIGIDVSRGLALLGMIAVHALFPFDEDFNPNWVTSTSPPEMRRPCSPCWPASACR